MWFETLQLDQLERLLITDQGDLSFAEELLLAYLRLDGSVDRVVLDGMSLAAVVVYARPFSGNRTRLCKREREEVLDFLSADLPHPDLHLEALNDRNTDIAHSDAQPKDATFHENGTTSIFQVPRLSQRQAAGLLRNVLVMRERLRQRLQWAYAPRSQVGDEQ